jgi:hypothetical protein
LGGGDAALKGAAGRAATGVPAAVTATAAVLPRNWRRLV